MAAALVSGRVRVFNGFVLVAVGFALAIAALPARTVVHTRTRVSVAGRETIYIRNLAPRFISDRTIQRDIPAWQQAANTDFARYWGTPQVNLLFIQGAAPKGAVVATFKGNGPIAGAVAFHGVFGAEPGIVVYAAVADYYNFSNSLAFTHELFELLADDTVSQLNWGWPSEYVYLGHQPLALPPNAIPVNEVCDPVERLSYRLHGVTISDFVTKNWFNDQIKGEPFDFMGLVPQPLTITRGGYAEFEVNGQVTGVQFFQHAGADAAGFLKGEKSAHTDR